MPRSSSNAVRAQVHAAAVLGATLGIPGASVLTRSGSASHDDVLAGVPVTVVQPTGAPPWPALVFMNGATPDGRAHPMVLRLSHALARTGHLVFIPDLPGIAGGELSPATLATASTFARHAADANEAADGRIALAGVSVGASLALLVAAEPELAGDVSVVVGVAPYTDLEKVMLLATTGTYRGDGTDVPYRVPPYLIVGLARSLAAMLRPTAAAGALCDELRAIDPDSARPIEFREQGFREAGDDAMTLFRLLANRDPGRFDDLYAALPAQIRATVGELSPLQVGREAASAGRARDRSAGPLLPGRRVARARRSIAARTAHRDVTSRTCDPPSEPALPGRARTPERLLRPRARRVGLERTATCSS